MLPSIFPGDTLLVLRQPIASVQPGHVVLFSREGRFCAHRVVRPIERGRAALCCYLRRRADSRKTRRLPSTNCSAGVTAVLRFGKRIELEQTKSAPSFWLRWAVRHSDSVGTWLLRWHSLRTRLARRSGAGTFALPEKSRGVHVNGPGVCIRNSPCCDHRLRARSHSRNRQHSDPSSIKRCRFLSNARAALCGFFESRDRACVHIRN